MIETIVNTPAPHELEQKTSFYERFLAHPTVVNNYPLAKRRIAAEARWAKAKLDSLVSVKTEAGEVLLYGSL